MTYRTANASHGYGSLAARIILTLAGAAGMIVGAFLAWMGSTRGTDLTDRAYISTNFGARSTFVMTAGFVMIILGLLAVLSLATASGWLARLAGAAGIVGFVLLAIQVYRSAGDQRLGVGPWLALAGSIVVLIAGFLPGPSVVTTDRTTGVDA